MPLFVRQILTLMGTVAASPWAFSTVAIYALLWIIFDRSSFNWHGIATLATWCMTLLIQRGEHRDTQAIHAKLDELLKSQRGASDSLAQIDEKEPEEIERFRDREKEKADAGKTRKESLERPRS
jgi:low affinity Fe/Cu permease